MPRRLLVLSLAALASLGASPAAHAAIDVQPLSSTAAYDRIIMPKVVPVPQPGQLPPGFKEIVMRCTSAPTPPPDNQTAPSDPTEQQVGTFTPQTGHAEEVIDLGPCPQEPAAHEPEPEPEPRDTTTPTGKPSDDQELEDAERARQEAQRRARQLLDDMARRQGGVIGGMTR